MFLGARAVEDAGVWAQELNGKRKVNNVATQSRDRAVKRDVGIIVLVIGVRRESASFIFIK